MQGDFVIGIVKLMMQKGQNFFKIEFDLMQSGVKMKIDCGGLMEKELIGRKIKIHIMVAVLVGIAGIGFIAGAVFMFLFVIGGAVGGAVAGALVALGISLVAMSVMSRILPDELVYIDDQMLYLNRNVVNISDIQSVSGGNFTLVVRHRNGRPIRQSFVKNAAECAEKIRMHIQPQVVQTLPSQSNDSKG